MIRLFRDAQGEPRIHGNTAHKSTWLSFRGWLFFGSGCCLNLEWVIKPDVTPAIGFTVGEGDRPEVTLRLGVPFLISIWFTLEWTRLKLLVPTVRTESVLKPGEFWDMPISRFTGVRVFGNQVWFDLWADQDDEMHNRKWQRFNLKLPGFGKRNKG